MHNYARWLMRGAAVVAVFANVIVVTHAQEMDGLVSAEEQRRQDALRLRSGQAALHMDLGAMNASARISAGADSGAALPEPPAPKVRGYKPTTGNERLWWLFTTTLGPQHLAGGVISSAYGTAVNHPREDGTHWGGFGERFGIRLTGVAVSNTMEAGMGALWGEDPRYDREAEQTFRERVASVIKQTFVTRRRDGEFAPAYARYLAITGSNFLSNTWRADSEADASHAAIRTLEGFAGRLATNSWEEFWPSAKALVFHRSK